MKDKLLVYRAKKGDRDALRRIYQKYRDHLLILAVAVLNDVHAAEDAVHDVFVGFVRNIDSFKLTGSLKGYLSVCTANRARNLATRKSKRDIGLEQVEESAACCDNSPSERLLCNEQLERLTAALSALPDDQRQAVVLHIHGGLKLKTIAAQQNVPVDTVKSRYRYGIKKLRSILNGEVER